MDNPLIKKRLRNTAIGLVIGTLISMNSRQQDSQATPREWQEYRKSAFQLIADLNAVGFYLPKNNFAQDPRSIQILKLADGNIDSFLATQMLKYTNKNLTELTIERYYSDYIKAHPEALRRIEEFVNSNQLTPKMKQHLEALGEKYEIGIKALNKHQKKSTWVWPAIGGAIGFGFPTKKPKLSNIKALSKRRGQRRT